MNRRKVRLEVSGFDLSCLEDVLRPLKSPTAAGAMTIGSAQMLVEEIRKAFNAAAPKPKPAPTTPPRRFR